MAKKKSTADKKTAKIMPSFIEIIAKSVTERWPTEKPIKIHTHVCPDSDHNHILAEWNDGYWIALCQPDSERPGRLAIASGTIPAVFHGRAYTCEAEINRITTKQFIDASTMTLVDLANSIVQLMQAMRTLRLVL